MTEAANIATGAPASAEALVGAETWFLAQEREHTEIEAQIRAEERKPMGSDAEEIDRIDRVIRALFERQAAICAAVFAQPARTVPALAVKARMLKWLPDLHMLEGVTLANAYAFQHEEDVPRGVASLWADIEALHSVGALVEAFDAGAGDDAIRQRARAVYEALSGPGTM